MKRRMFIDFAGKSALAAVLFNDYSCSGGLPDSRYLVESREKRQLYLSKMLKALVTDLGPRWVGTPEMEKAEQIVKTELAFKDIEVLAQPGQYIGKTAAYNGKPPGNLTNRSLSNNIGEK